MYEEYEQVDENFYSEDARGDLIEADGISAEEEAFMRGYDEAELEEELGEEEQE